MSSFPDRFARSIPPSLAPPPKISGDRVNENPGCTAKARMRTNLRVAALFAACLVSGAAHALEAVPNGLPEVLDELRRGGLVIYFRHAPTEASEAADSDVADCATQRNLTPQGRALAVRIGAAMRSLQIPVGKVASSPFCRCVDTAKLAFGRFEVDTDLRFAMTTTPEETERLALELRRMLASAPRAGTNTVLISHTANLREAANLWPKPEGAAYIFRPLPGGRFVPIARVAPEAWQETARLAAAR